MAIQLGLRRATQSQWSAANPVLEEGEIVVESDTNQVKIGDGITDYNSLSYGFDKGLSAESFNVFF